MIEYFVLAFIVVAFILASYEDIKKREVYDYVNYCLAFAVLIAGTIDSLSSGSFDPIKYIFFGMILGFLFGAMFYYLGFWGGGDAKFLIGFGGAIVYLPSFTNSFQGFLNEINAFFIYSNSFTPLINQLLEFIFFINLLFIIILAIKFLFKKEEETKDILALFAILIFFTTAIFIKTNLLYLSVLGFIAFLFMFLADEKIFSVVYLTRKIPVKQLKLGDKIDEEIKVGKEKISYSEAIQGLTAGHIEKLHSLKEEIAVKKRIIVPYTQIVGINLLLFCIKIISLDILTMNIFLFLIAFLFLSFIVGGLIAILILTFVFIKNYKKIKIKFEIIEKLIILIPFLFGVLVLFFRPQIAILFFSIALIVPFIKTAREAEKFLFVSKKEISKLVPGDWIVEDFKVGKKLVYSEEDFKLGINEKQVANMKKLSSKLKDKTILVKDGLAFIPPLFIGFIILILI